MRVPGNNPFAVKARMGPDAHACVELRHSRGRHRLRPGRRCWLSVRGRQGNPVFVRRTNVRSRLSRAASFRVSDWPALGLHGLLEWYNHMLVKPSFGGRRVERSAFPFRVWLGLPSGDFLAGQGCASPFD